MSGLTTHSDGRRRETQKASRTLERNTVLVLKSQSPVSYTHLDVYKRQEYDVVVVLDSSDLGRIEGVYERLSPGIPIVNIDHHSTNKGYGTYNYVRCV